jgi:hypothetical protein
MVLKLKQQKGSLIPKESYKIKEEEKVIKDYQGFPAIQ